MRRAGSSTAGMFSTCSFFGFFTYHKSIRTSSQCEAKEKIYLRDQKLLVVHEIYELCWVSTHFALGGDSADKPACQISCNTSLTTSLSPSSSPSSSPSLSSV